MSSCGEAWCDVASCGAFALQRHASCELACVMFHCAYRHLVMRNLVVCNLAMPIGVFALQRHVVRHVAILHLVVCLRCSAMHLVSLFV